MAWNTGVNGVMAGIMNHGTKIIRVRRAGMMNVQTGAISGTLAVGSFIKYTNIDTWNPSIDKTVITPHDSNNAALDDVRIGYSGISTGTLEALGVYAFGNEEVTVSGATLGAVCAIPYVGMRWTLGYGDSEVQPVTLNFNEAFLIRNSTGTVGTADFWFEFTSENA